MPHRLPAIADGRSPAQAWAGHAGAPDGRPRKAPMVSTIQVIAVVVMLTLSVGYLVFVAWASNRRREEAEAERLTPHATPETEQKTNESPKPQA